MLHCPPFFKLEQLVAGQLIESEATSVLIHVQSCASCESSLAELESRSGFLHLANDDIAGDRCSDAGHAGTQRPPARRIASPAAALSLEIGSLLGDYQIVRLLGKGGMGIVYEATHLNLRRQVAVKLFPRLGSSNNQLEKRFRREISALASVMHPNVVQAFDSRSTDSCHYLVMEYVDGIDLSAVTKRVGAWPVEAACEVIYQTAQGLGYLHSREMVHRDIKPSNLMLTLSQEPTSKKLCAVAKILDLGIVSVGNGDEITQTGGAMGTPQFMAPEQFFDSKHADVRADIYSLGATLTYLLTGGHSNSRKSMETLSRSDQFWSTHKVPRPLVELLQGMLCHDVSKRLDNLTSIARTLQRFSSQQSLQKIARQCDLISSATPDDELATLSILRPHESSPYVANSTHRRQKIYLLLVLTLIGLGGSVAYLLPIANNEKGKSSVIDSKEIAPNPAQTNSAQAIVVDSTPTVVDSVPAPTPVHQSVSGDAATVNWAIGKGGRVSGQDGKTPVFHSQLISGERFGLWGVTFLGQDIRPSELSKFKHCKLFSMGYFSLKKLTPEHLLEIQIPTIDALHLGSQELSTVSEKDLANLLDKLRALWGVRLQNLGVDGKVLWNLKGRTDLAYIGVRGDKAKRSGMVPNVGRSALEFIAACPRLQAVDLAYTNPTFDDLVLLANIETLTELNLSGLSAAVEVLQKMAESPRLEFLDIDNIRIGVPDLQLIGKFKKLRYLSMMGAGLEQQAIAGLSSEIPSCHIRTDYGLYGPPQPDWSSVGAWYRIADNLPQQVY